MHKIGYREIVGKKLHVGKPRCLSCGKRARKIVTYKDDWVTLKVALCNDCTLKPFEELNLQKTIDFPAFA